MYRFTVVILALPSLAVAGCSSEPADEPREILLEGPQFNELELFVPLNQSINDLALGGTQRIAVRDALTGEPFDGFEADAGEHLAIEAIEGNVITVRGVAAGGSRLRIWEGDQVIGATSIVVTPSDTVALGHGPSWYQGELIYEGAMVPLVARIKGGTTRLVDETVQIVTPMPSTRVAWDTVVVEAPAGSFDVELRATGLPAATVTVETTTTIDQVDSLRFADVVCFEALQGDQHVAYVPWEIEVSGGTLGEPFAEDCVTVEAEEGATVTVTATEPGGLSATATYVE